MAIRADAGKCFNAYTFTEPYVDPNAAFVGTKLSFEATDINGNAVKSEDLFKDSKVTMVNFWATSCHGCIDEMPKLEALNKELAEKDCQIVGICYDTFMGDEYIDLAKQIVEEQGVTYTNVPATMDMAQAIPISTFPTTFFVSSDGTVLSLPVVSADFGAYSTGLEAALALAEN